jgi:hypothetical protein
MLHKHEAGTVDAVINTNLGSLFNMTRQVIEGMRARKFGRIINISSINGQKGQFGQVNYSAAKAGEIGFTKALALESAKAASPSTPSARATSIPRWCRRCRRRCWRRASCRSFRSAGSASRRRSRAAWCSSPPTMPGFITGSTLTANGGQYITIYSRREFIAGGGLSWRCGTNVDTSRDVDQILPVLDSLGDRAGAPVRRGPLLCHRRGALQSRPSQPRARRHPRRQG